MYPVKHFLTTIILTPLLIELYAFIVDQESLIGGIYFTMLALSFGFALPTYTIYHIAYVQLLKKKPGSLVAKSILNVIAILGYLMTMVILQGGLSFDLIFAAYPIVIVLTSFLFRLEI